jgi:large subunit ribosomal protein L17
MRHSKSGRQFSRNSSHRRAMLRSLTANLIAHERIETTDAKAKELRRVAERVITKARRLGEVAYTPHDKLSLADRARRYAAQQQVAKFLQRFATIDDGATDAQKVDLIEKVFVDLAQRYKSRAGGYTRITKMGNRRGDNAPISIIELVDRDESKGKATAATPAAKEEQVPAKKAEAKAEKKPSEKKAASEKKPAAESKSDDKKAEKKKSPKASKKESDKESPKASKKESDKE